MRSPFVSLRSGPCLETWPELPAQNFKIVKQSFGIRSGQGSANSKSISLAFCSEDVNFKRGSFPKLLDKKHHCGENAPNFNTIWYINHKNETNYPKNRCCKRNETLEHFAVPLVSKFPCRKVLMISTVHKEVILSCYPWEIRSGKAKPSGKGSAAIKVPSGDDEYHHLTLLVHITILIRLKHLRSSTFVFY